MRRLRTAAIVLVFLNACATNPARHLEPNSEDITLRGKDFYRGADKLDEEEFYTLTDDTASAQTIHATRSTASLIETLGMSLLVTGGIALVGGIGGRALHDTGAVQLPDEMQDPLLYVGLGGAVAGLFGYYLFSQYKPVAMGATREFDVAHAQASLERSLYGPNGPQPELIKSLEVATEDALPRFCSTTGTTLKPLVARDEKGRTMLVDTHPDWLSWTSKPDGILEDIPGGEDEDGVRILGKKIVVSPLTRTLKDLDSQVHVQVTVPASGLKQSVDLKADFGCPGSKMELSGPKGAAGARGSKGQGGGAWSSAPGGTGDSGGSGADGADGDSIEVEAAWVNTPGHGRLLLVASSARGHDSKISLFDPSKGGAFEVLAGGGRGGHGGKGGDGGSGGSGDASKCTSGGNGGSGGRGGTGGRGGNGGHISIALATADLEPYVHGSAPGGNGGDGGSGGRGGFGGAAGGCRSSSDVRTTSGKMGSDGSSGSGGAAGHEGRVDVRVTSATALRLIPRVLETNPTVTLEGRVAQRR